MNTDEKLDQVSDTIAFLLARIKGDTEAAFTIIGEGDDFKGLELLMGMTDLAMAMTMVMAPLVGTTPEKLVRTMALGAKLYGPEFMGGGK